MPLARRPRHNRPTSPAPDPFLLSKPTTSYTIDVPCHYARMVFGFTPECRSDSLWNSRSAARNPHKARMEREASRSAPQRKGFSKYGRLDSGCNPASRPEQMKGGRTRDFFNDFRVPAREHARRSWRAERRSCSESEPIHRRAPKRRLQSAARLQAKPASDYGEAI